MNQNRVQKGVPTGGRFAPSQHAESDLVLASDDEFPRSPQSGVMRPDGRPLHYRNARTVANEMPYGTDHDFGYVWTDNGRDSLRVSLVVPTGQDHGALYVHDQKNGQSAIVAEDVSEDEVDHAFRNAIVAPNASHTTKPLAMFLNRLPRAS